MLRALLALVRQAGAADETDTDRDGFLSYAAETHAVGLGVYDGLRTKRPTAGGDLRDNPDVEAEPHYYAGGFVLGTVVQALVVGGTAVAALQLL